MVNPVTVPNFSQYNFAIGDTTEVVTKQNGVNAALQQFGNSLNSSIDLFNDDVEFVDTARQELDADNIVHAPGSGLPNEAGTAYSSDMGTAGNQIRTNQQNDGRYYTQDQVDSLLAARLPAGLITMWSGAVNAVPSGWALCNGSNGTPDLRNRFIVGAGNTYSVGSTGGASSVTLSVAQIPSHNHTGSTGNDTHDHGGGTQWNGSHDHGGGTQSGGSHAHRLFKDTFNQTDSVPGFNDSIARHGTSNADGSDRYSVRAGNTGNNVGVSTTVGTHNHGISSDGHHNHNINSYTHSHNIPEAGGGGSHENRPPFYALAYIMKL